MQRSNWNETFKKANVWASIFGCFMYHSGHVLHHCVDVLRHRYVSVNDLLPSQLQSEVKIYVFVFQF